MTPDTPKPPAPSPASAETLEQQTESVGTMASRLEAASHAMRDKANAAKAQSMERLRLLREAQALMAGADALRRLQSTEPSPASAETLEHAGTLQWMADSFAREVGDGSRWQGVIIHDSTIEALRAGADALRRLQSTAPEAAILDHWDTSGLPTVARFNHAVDVANALHRRLQSTEQELAVWRRVASPVAERIATLEARAEAAEQRLRDLEQEQG